MGQQCCSNSASTENEVTENHTAALHFTERQMMLIIRIQSAFRGYNTRKRVRALKASYSSPGIGRFGNFDPSQTPDFNNVNVQVRINKSNVRLP